MIRFHSNRSLYKFLTILLIAGIYSNLCDTANAKKIHTALCGRIYLHNGASIIADGDIRVGIPLKKKELEIIENPYTKNSGIQTRINPSEVDSVTIWQPTSPEHPHTFRFIKDCGWCWEAERSPYIAVYCYSPKGYYFAGNGGLWMRGKSKMLVIKDGKKYYFGQPNKYADKKFRTQLEKLVADDPVYCEYLRKVTGRRDKILRSLVLYTPEQSPSVKI